MERIDDSSEKFTIELGGKCYLLRVRPFETEIEIDEIVKIDYSNLVGEILTFPVLFNRVGLLKAEVENIEALEKFDLDVFYAQLLKEYRKTLVSSGTKVTISEIESSVLLDTRYIAKKKAYLNLIKQKEYITSLYWSAKSKDEKLNKLSDKLRPEEFSSELLEDTVNGVFIKRVNKLL